VKPTADDLRETSILLALALGALLLASPAAAHTKLEVPLLLAPSCASIPGCPIDTLVRASFRMRSTTAAATNGLSFTVKLAGARRVGLPATFTGRVGVDLRVTPPGGSDTCARHLALPPLAVATGTGRLVFTRAEVAVAGVVQDRHGH
jgi:hypothetical protein